MKIEAKAKTDVESHLDLSGYIINYVEIDRLIGQVLTLIETIGLEGKRENSLKSIIKQMIRSNISSNQNTFISKEIYDVICKFNQELQEACIKNSVETPNKEGACLRDGEYKLTFISTH